MKHQFIAILICLIVCFVTQDSIEKNFTRYNHAIFYQKNKTNSLNKGIKRLGPK
jgi:Zn-dependent membrane protease YugP